MLDGYGNVLHYPAGSYDAHMKDQYSQALLTLAMYGKSLEDIFSRLHANDDNIKKAGITMSQNRLRNKIIAWEKENLNG